MRAHLYKGRSKKTDIQYKIKKSKMIIGLIENYLIITFYWKSANLHMNSYFIFSVINFNRCLCFSSILYFQSRRNSAKASNSHNRKMVFRFLWIQCYRITARPEKNYSHNSLIIRKAPCISYYKHNKTTRCSFQISRKVKIARLINDDG